MIKSMTTCNTKAATLAYCLLAHHLHMYAIQDSAERVKDQSS